MTPNEVTEQIQRWDADATNVTVVSSGATNITGIAGPLVYRFPLTETALAMQLYEAALYQKLDDRLSVPTPRFVRTYEQPECIVITRLDGEHTTVEALAALPAEELRPIIRQLLEFSLSFNTVLSPQEIQTMEKTHITTHLPDRPWHEYLHHHLAEARFADQPWLEELAHTQYAKWQRTVQASTLPNIVVHDDLHTKNMLFFGHTISGIVDFGEATVGTIAQELRQLYRISDEAVHIAIEEYAAMTGVAVSFDEIVTWAITQELASYCRWTAQGNRTRPSFLRAQATLRRWLKDFPG